ncbi:MAG: ion transporter [Ruminococcus sp.]|nr:ion transporter [Ruminococcus sp.]
MSKQFKKRVFEIIQIGNKDDIPSRLFDIFLAVIIIINILAMVLETFEELAGFRTLFGAVEIISIAFFCVEYFLRIWTADLLYPKKKKAAARLRFLFSYDGIVDLFTILPFYFLSGFIVFRMLRVVRIFHLFRINTQYDSFNVIVSVLVEKKNQIISSLFIIIVLMIASSIGIYSAEHKVQPEVFKNAFSGIWWSVSTLLTVGYGDIYPVTVMGKVMAICIAFLGVGAVAIPTGIISAGFVEHYTRQQNSEKKLKDISELGEVLIDEKSELLGRTVGEISSSRNADVILIMREGLAIIASENVKTQSGDILILRGQGIER